MIKKRYQQIQIVKDALSNRSNIQSNAIMKSQLTKYNNDQFYQINLREKPLPFIQYQRNENKILQKLLNCNMKLDLDIYQWLVKINVIQELPINNLFAHVDQALEEQFLNGIIVSQILKQFDQKIDVDVKQGNSNGIRLFNWNNVCRSLQQINITLDDDIKISIVKGDTQMLMQFLKEIKQHYEMAFYVEEQVSTTTRFDSQQNEPQEISIEEIDPEKPLNQTQSLLEFIIVSLCKHFTLKPKQAVVLLNQNYKQLSNILIKGNKSFKSVINWLMELSKYINHIIKFVTYKIDILLSLLKAGLVSQNNEVCYWTLYIIEGILINLPQKELLEDVYAWLVREHGGLIVLILSQQRHHQYLEQVCKIYSVVSQYNVVDFFDVQLRKILKSGKEYIDFINGIIQTIQIRDQMQELNLFELFASHAVKLFEPQHTAMERMTALKYFEHYWIFYPQSFVIKQMEQYLLNSRKATRESSFAMRIFTYQSLFRILDNLALQKDKYAALLYKKLVFSLIENFDQKGVREFLVANFLMLIRKYSTIPLDILIIPMVKQLQIEQNEVQINIVDFQLLKSVCTHPKIDVNIAILMLDMLSKLYLSSIISNYFQLDLLSQIKFKNLPLTLQKLQYLNIMATIRNMLKVVQMKIFKRQQFRSQIISLIKFIINLRSFELNEQIKPVIAHFYLEIQQNLKTESKALFMLLGHFGDPQEIIQEEQKKQKQVNQQPQQSIFQSQIVKSQLQGSKISQVQSGLIHPKSNKGTIPQKDDPFRELRDDANKPSLTMLGNLSLNFDEQSLLKQFELL
ncbi:unnamed protein product (macronuclear) [Paramecium tetraurelia]|uniref:CH-like domain-containing protein n=1 Tax=Paramecium tetraurelia TaxID=5888 RepID=A0BR66_PARTE|nr:uncharacterized protein GSPATT00031263001 [Paramecium tetraurelia]CAK61033.1 unnamed protein product [Paramecium tetraurelia]|eukprot:XP_001428431.1 hypothetical protein (macronuclear) [Paramecium tetraurelia strain d4-2]